MSYITYQILNLTRAEDGITTLSLLKAVDKNEVQATLVFEPLVCLQLECEKDWHLVAGYSPADITLSDTFSGEEAIQIIEGVYYHLSEKCLAISRDAQLKKGMFITVQQ